MTADFASGWRGGWHVVPWQVTWRDLDAAGHVNNAVFLTFFEWGRTRYWMDLHGGAIGPESIGFIVARAEIDYLRQLGLGDRIEIATRVDAMRNSSFDFQGEIRNAEGETVARSRVVVVHFSWSENRKEPIPDDLRQRIQDFQV